MIKLTKTVNKTSKLQFMRKCKSNKKKRKKLTRSLQLNASLIRKLTKELRRKKVGFNKKNIRFSTKYTRKLTMELKLISRRRMISIWWSLAMWMQARAHSWAISFSSLELWGSSSCARTRSYAMSMARLVSSSPTLWTKTKKRGNTESPSTPHRTASSLARGLSLLSMPPAIKTLSPTWFQEHLKHSALFLWLIRTQVALRKDLTTDKPRSMPSLLEASELLS